MAKRDAELLLVRHADAAWTEDELGGLSEKGHRDAERLADKLAGFACVAIYSSPLPRALQTVEPLAHRLGLAIREMADLRERKLGGGPFPDFRAAVRATWDDFCFSHPGGESNAEAQRRMVAANERILDRHPDGRIVVATHGNVLALLLRHYEPSIGFHFWERLTRPDVYRLRVDAGNKAFFVREWDEP